MRFAWLLVLCALGGCAKIDRLTLRTSELSPDLTHLAVLALGPEATIVGASGLLLKDESIEVALERTGETTELAIYGYRSAQIAELSPPSDPELRRTPLQLRRAGDPPFPDPSGILMFGPDGKPSVEPGPPIELTASWLARCARLAGPDTRVDIRCSGCAAAVSQNGCVLSIAPSNCTLGGDGVVGLDSVAFDASASFGSCTVNRDESGTALHCAEAAGGCVIDLEEPSGPAFEVMTRSLVTGPFASNRDRMGLESAPFGYLHDLLPIEDGALVAEPGGGATDWRCPLTGAPLAPGKLHRLLGPGLEPVSTATTPPCLLRLLPGAGGRVLAIAGVAPQRLFELELDGTIVRSLPFTEPDAEGLLVADVVGLGADEVAILFAGSDLNARTVLWVVDRRTFAPSRAPLLLHPRARLLFVDGPTRVGAVIPDDNAIVVADVAAGMVEPPRKLECFNLGLTGISAVAKRGDETWLTSRLPAARAFVARGLDYDCVSVAAWERDLQLDTIALDPARPLGFFGASTTDAAEIAYLLRVDTAASKVLGGSIEVGRGPLSRLQLRGDELLGILPATGEVMRAVVP